MDSNPDTSTFEDLTLAACDLGAVAFGSYNVAKVDLIHMDLPPCCLEFMPMKEKHIDALESGPTDCYLVVGTYHLEEAIQNPASAATETPPFPQQRKGGLSLFKLLADNKLKLVDRIPYPSGVLDLHFIPNSQFFAAVSSTGAVSLFGFFQNAIERPGQQELKFRHIATHQIFSDSTLITSFIWIPQFTPTQLPIMAATISTGHVYLVSFGDWEFSAYHILNNKRSINHHDDQAWICAVCPSLRYVYSGGDDSMFQFRQVDLGAHWLTHSGTQEMSVEYQKFRGHDAGVISILPLPYRQQRMVLTGSYDDHVRLFIMNSAKPKELASLKLDGGPWRLKFLQDYPIQDEPEEKVKYRILVSCMYVGAKVLELEREGPEKWVLREVAFVHIHKSMCYASDVRPLDSQTTHYPIGVESLSQRMCVSSSFYDKILTVWTLEPLLPMVHPTAASSYFETSNV